jgi:hypothetical protein
MKATVNLSIGSVECVESVQNAAITDLVRVWATVNFYIDAEDLPDLVRAKRITLTVEE